MVWCGGRDYSPLPLTTQRELVESPRAYRLRRFGWRPLYASFADPPRSSRKGRRGGAPCACWLSQISLRRLRGKTPDLGKFAFSLGKGSRFLLSRRNDDQLRGPSIPPRSSRNGGSAPSGGSDSRRAPRIRHTPRIRHFDIYNMISFLMDRRLRTFQSLPRPLYGYG